MRSELEVNNLLNEMKDAIAHYDRLCKDCVPLILRNAYIDRIAKVYRYIELLEWTIGRDVNWDWREHRQVKRWLIIDEEQATKEMDVNNAE